jgi:hypothetical protein
MAFLQVLLNNETLAKKRTAEKIGGRRYEARQELRSIGAVRGSKRAAAAPSLLTMT